jgi:small subunit ribosomal protein S9
MADNSKSTAKKHEGEFVFAVGRRREAIARVRLYETVKDDLTYGETPVKKGDILVNAMPISDYFSGEVSRYVYSEPLRVTNTQNKFTWTIQVEGGGKSGQLQAVVAGIANALNKLNEKEYRPILKKKGFMTRDPRIRQRRKVGMGGKSRRQLQSPKR